MHNLLETSPGGLLDVSLQRDLIKFKTSNVKIKEDSIPLPSNNQSSFLETLYTI